MRDISFVKAGSRENQIKLGFRRPVTPTVIELTKLAQEYIIMLLKTPGFDSFRRDLGGGLRTVASSSETTLRPIVNSIIEKTNTDVKSVQIGQGLPNDELLSSARLVTLEVLNNNILKIDIRITSISQKSAFVELKI
jgi:hypothetical protein